MPTEGLGNITSIKNEASDNLGDVRRTKRLKSMLDRMASNPQASLPQVFKCQAELAAAYRLLSNEAIDWQAIEAGHSAQTMARCQEADRVLVIHDTTDISFKLHDPDWRRLHLPRMSSQRQGFYWHAALAVADKECPLALGLVGSQPFVHQKHIDNSSDRSYWKEQGGFYDNESKRWFDVLAHSRDQFKEMDQSPIHLMDRDADSITLLSELVEHDDRFVVRVRITNRKLARGDKNLSEVLEDQPFVGQKRLHLGFRSRFRNAKKRRKHPPRKERDALVALRSAQVTIAPGRRQDVGYLPADRSLPESLTLNVIEMVERNPPEGEAGVRWYLWTSEPVETADQIEKVIEWYHRRWIIEEFYKAIKTGCRIEQRQLRSADAILRMLAISSISAWWLLATRALARTDTEMSWRVALDPLSFSILCRASEKYDLDEGATVTDVLKAIAGLGGHLSHNGPPGWLTLMRGLISLTEKVEGARLLADALGLSNDLSQMC